MATLIKVTHRLMGTAGNSVRYILNYFGGGGSRKRIFGNL